MAIVRTTSKEQTSGGTETPESNGPVNGAAPVDRTRSVVRAQPQARPTRPVGARAPIQTVPKPAARGAFMQDTLTELRRVVWPTRAEVQAGTIVTIGLLIFFSLYIFGLDFLVSKLFVAIGLLPSNVK